MPTVQYITSPTHNVLRMLARRIDPETREKVLAGKWGAVGLVQDRLPNVLAMADVVEKQTRVLVDVVAGTCPQQFTMIAIFGDTASVKAALESVENMNTVN